MVSFEAVKGTRMKSDQKNLKKEKENESLRNILYPQQG